jgi:hypothetical protein
LLLESPPKFTPQATPSVWKRCIAPFLAKMDSPALTPPGANCVSGESLREIYLFHLASFLNGLDCADIPLHQKIHVPDLMMLAQLRSVQIVATQGASQRQNMLEYQIELLVAEAVRIRKARQPAQGTGGNTPAYTQSLAVLAWLADGARFFHSDPPSLNLQMVDNQHAPEKTVNVHFEIDMYKIRSQQGATVIRTLAHTQLQAPPGQYASSNTSEDEIQHRSTHPSSDQSSSSNQKPALNRPSAIGGVTLCLLAKPVVVQASSSSSTSATSGISGSSKPQRPPTKCLLRKAVSSKSQQTRAVPNPTRLEPPFLSPVSAQRCTKSPLAKGNVTAAVLTRPPLKAKKSQTTVSLSSSAVRSTMAVCVHATKTRDKGLHVTQLTAIPTSDSDLKKTSTSDHPKHDVVEQRGAVRQTKSKAASLQIAPSISSMHTPPQIAKPPRAQLSISSTSAEVKNTTHRKSGSSTLIRAAPQALHAKPDVRKPAAKRGSLSKPKAVIKPKSIQSITVNAANPKSRKRPSTGTGCVPTPCSKRARLDPSSVFPGLDGCVSCMHVFYLPEAWEPCFKSSFDNKPELWADVGNDNPDMKGKCVVSFSELHRLQAWAILGSVDRMLWAQAYMAVQSLLSRASPPDVRVLASVFSSTHAQEWFDRMASCVHTALRTVSTGLLLE